MIDYDAELRDAFIAEIEGYIPELRAHLARLRADPKHKDALEETYRLAHTIKGSAAMLGYADLSALGVALEQRFNTVLEKKVKLTPTMLDDSAQDVTAVELYITALRAENAPPAVAEAAPAVAEAVPAVADVAVRRPLPQEAAQPALVGMAAPIEAVAATDAQITDDDVRELLSDLYLDVDTAEWLASVMNQMLGTPDDAEGADVAVRVALPDDALPGMVDVRVDDSGVALTSVAHPQPAAAFDDNLEPQDDADGRRIGGYGTGQLSALGLTDAEIAQLADLDAAQREADASLDSPELGGMFVAEAQGELDALAAHIAAFGADRSPAVRAVRIHGIANTLRKGATMMDLMMVADQAEVIASLAGMVSEGGLPPGQRTATVLTDAYRALVELLAPYQPIAQAILAGAVAPASFTPVTPFAPPPDAPDDDFAAMFVETPAIADTAPQTGVRAQEMETAAPLATFEDADTVRDMWDSPAWLQSVAGENMGAAVTAVESAPAPTPTLDMWDSPAWLEAPAPEETADAADFGGYSTTDLAEMGLSADEIAQLAEMEAAQQTAETGNDELGALFVAEAWSEITTLAAHVAAFPTDPSRAAAIRASAATIRKGAAMMDVPQIAEQAEVVETLGGLVADGMMETGPQTDTLMANAMRDLDAAIAPYHDAAQAILAGTAAPPPDAGVTAAPRPEADAPIEPASASMPTQTAEPASVAVPPQAADEDDFGAVFAEEAEEHIHSLDTNLAALERDPHRRDVLREIRRTAHTLKGSAAMVGFGVISQTAHLMEDLLDRLYDGAVAVDDAAISLLFQTFSTIENMVSGLRAGGAEDSTALDVLRPAYAALLVGDVAADMVTPDENTAALAIFASSPFARPVTTAAPATPVFHPVAADEASAGPQQNEQLAVRVDIRRLDGIMNQVGELVINRSILERRVQVYSRTIEEVRLTIQRLQRTSREIATRYEVEFLQDTTLAGGTSALPSGSETTYRVLPPATPSAGSQGFDSLELDRYTVFHSLSRDLTEAVADLVAAERELLAVRADLENVTVQQARITADLQDRLVGVRLVPLSNLTPRLYRTIRTIAQAQDKEVQFVVSGDATPVDKTIFEEIADPLLHMVRNAVDHGIETPAERTAHGKPSGGTISLSARTEGNQVVIEVRDDGAGIDPAWVRQRAIERGVIPPDSHLTDAEAVDLLFQPGFSTATEVSEYSGRGVGLDVVRVNIQRLKGTIDIDSSPGNGTRLVLRLPITLAITQALLFRVDNLTYATPITVIERTTRLDPAQIVMVGDQPVYQLDEDGQDRAPLLRLGDRLQLPAELRPPAPLDDVAARKARPVVVINAPQRKVALVVDELMEQQEIVVKPLGAHLRTMPGIIGATILGSGDVVPILDLYALIGSFGLNLNLRAQPTRFYSGTTGTGRVVDEAEADTLAQQHAAEAAALADLIAPAAPTAPVARIPVIQVVDDSLSIRRVVTASLEKAGFTVRTSKDGQEALEAVQRAAPDLLVMDIEMPRMDGYELTSILKSRAAFRHIPIVMLTSRAGARHRQRAEEVGADGYLIKPYQEADLLTIVSELLMRSRTNAVAVG